MNLFFSYIATLFFLVVGGLGAGYDELIDLSDHDAFFLAMMNSILCPQCGLER